MTPGSTYGKGHIGSGGYFFKSVDGKSRREHVVVAEKALGKPLPPEAVVHHWDLNRANNDPHNLLICPNAAYHNLIHQRMRAMDASGNPNFRLCQGCKQWDEPAAMVLSGAAAWHRECKNAALRAWNAKRRAADPRPSKRVKLVVLDDIEASIASHARRRGLNAHTVYTRLARGLSIEEAFLPGPTGTGSPGITSQPLKKVA